MFLVVIVMTIRLILNQGTISWCKWEKSPVERSNKKFFVRLGLQSKCQKLDLKKYENNTNVTMRFLFMHNPDWCRIFEQWFKHIWSRVTIEEKKFDFWCYRTWIARLLESPLLGHSSLAWYGVTFGAGYLYLASLQCNRQFSLLFGVAQVSIWSLTLFFHTDCSYSEQKSCHKWSEAQIWLSF